MSVLAQGAGRTAVFRGGAVSLRVERRSVVVTALLGVVTVGSLLAALLLGYYTVSIDQVVRAVFSEGTPAEEYIISDLRLPRALTALMVGAALAMSGAIFQTLTRNPLGSPDVIGFDTGAATGALVVMLMLGGSGVLTSVGAGAGGAITAAVVYLLAMHRGSNGFRLVLMGIGVGALLLSVNHFLITRSTLYDAQSAAVWLIGNLAGRGWGHVQLLAPALLVLSVLALRMSRDLRMGELSDDSAAALGLSIERSRVLCVAIGVGLAGVAVAAAGPIAFIALPSPQIARRLTKVPGPNLVPSALVGASLLCLADLAGRELFVPRQVPVGVLTGVVGGLYLVWLLTREWRKDRR
ncbi:FecCD family ABC transporter permease [Nocardioides jensenii]|uniref:FecCD family ABC transporter permease n=1 Tax=Nocardioides jensenii TaxID=1843 RepID=UPI000834856E|nr:iron chelate uptake ABC transporter family permease subunit [Nocardioides jensenii]